MKSPRRPGDLILDRYFPDASEEAREQAREDFRKLTALFLKIGDRLEREDRELNSHNSEAGCKISPTL
jgi:hypothetical protein